MYFSLLNIHKVFSLGKTEIYYLTTIQLLKKNKAKSISIVEKQNSLLTTRVTFDF